MSKYDPKEELAFYRDAIKFLFDAYYMGSGVWDKGRTTFLGVPIFQNPFDLWVLQEIIVKTKPNKIIETGTAWGGTALYYATLYDTLALCTKLQGDVITIDIVYNDNRVSHPRITYLEGSSISKSILDTVHKSINEDDKVMVILDSDHTKEHVAKELELYSDLVSKECYLVVCDTNLSALAIPSMLRNKLDHFPKQVLENLKSVDGYPMSAVLDFLAVNKDFGIDKDCEKFGFTFNPNGFLKRLN